MLGLDPAEAVEILQQDVLTGKETPPAPYSRTINQSCGRQRQQIEFGQTLCRAQNHYLPDSCPNGPCQAKRISLSRQQMIMEGTTPTRSITESGFDLLGKMVQNKLEAP